MKVQRGSSPLFRQSFSNACEENGIGTQLLVEGASAELFDFSSRQTLLCGKTFFSFSLQWALIFVKFNISLSFSLTGKSIVVAAFFLWQGY